MSLTVIIFFSIFFLLVLFFYYLQKKDIFDILHPESIIVLPVIILIGFIAWSFKKIQSLLKSNYIKDKIIIIGPEIVSENSKEITFRMLASKNGKNEGVVYKSTEFTAPKDDIWLVGEINGMEIIALVNPDNPEKYKLVFDSVPPSQYS